MPCAGGTDPAQVLGSTLPSPADSCDRKLAQASPPSNALAEDGLAPPSEAGDGAGGVAGVWVLLNEDNLAADRTQRADGRYVCAMTNCWAVSLALTKLQPGAAINFQTGGCTRTANKTRSAGHCQGRNGERTPCTPTAVERSPDYRWSDDAIATALRDAGFVETARASDPGRHDASRRRTRRP